MMVTSQVLYITNVPIPDDAELDAHFQELELLCEHFNGHILSAFPFSKPSSVVPRSLYGLHNLSKIKKAAKSADIIHVFSATYFEYKYLKKFSRRPVIFSAMTPLFHKAKPMKNIRDYILYDKNSARKLSENPNLNVHVAPPFVDFQKEDLPEPNKPFTLLMASAPWEESQFRSKGVYLLLELLENIPDLNITFIWRNILYDKMSKLVENSVYKDRIQFVNGRVNITDHIRQAHAVILLSQFASLVKSYPHSLMEGLLCGRPILTTSSIPMSREIKEKQYGVVLEDFTLTGLIQATTDLMENYEMYRNNVKRLPQDRFEKSQFIALHKHAYQQLLAGRK